MRRAIAVGLVVLGLGGAVVSQGGAAVLAAEPHVAVIDLDDAIHPNAARFVKRAIAKATDDGARMLVIRLDTPGGLLDSTREIVEAILSSETPVVVYVAPEGAHAASAGTFLTAAAHAAAMAPVTNIGAASPVGLGQDLPETLERKASQDAAAFLREIAGERGRNVEALQSTVFEAASFSATEALDNNIVDLVADDLQDLIAQLDGTVVELRSGELRLDLEGVELRQIDRTPLELFLGFLSDPNVAFILVTIGLIGLFVEFILPGLWGPGILGVICLALGFVALGDLPVNWVGVALMVFAMVLFYIEVQAPGIGIFGVSGAIAFVVGGFLLVGGLTPPAIPQAPEAPSFRVNYFLLGGIAAAMLGLMLFVAKDLARARKLASEDRGTTVPIIGQVAVVTAALDPQGSVHVGGEEWTAVSDSGDPIEKGEEVIVSEADGLTLKVFRSSEAYGDSQL